MNLALKTQHLSLFFCVKDLLLERFKGGMHGDVDRLAYAFSLHMRQAPPASRSSYLRFPPPFIFLGSD